MLMKHDGGYPASGGKRDVLYQKRGGRQPLRMYVKNLRKDKVQEWKRKNRAEEELQFQQMWM